MARFSIDGFVIRGFSMGETSRVISLFTEQRGKVKGVAKGVRKSASSKGGALELFSRVRCNIYLKENVELGTISSVEPLQDYSKIAANPLKFGFCSAYFEIIDKLTTIDQPIPELYQLTGDFLQAISTAESEAVSVLFWAAFLKALAIVGYEPHLFECVVCGKTNDGKAAYYDPQKGGIICAKDLVEHVQYGKLSKHALALLQSFITEPLEKLCQIEADKKLLGDIERFITGFADYHTGLRRDLKSFKFLSQIKEK
jgi:DNA repair protein RecO (recombination protein O)